MVVCRILLLQQADGEHDVQQLVRVIQINEEKCLCPLQPVQEGGAVDEQLPGGLQGVKMAFDVAPQRLVKLCVVRSVILPQLQKLGAAYRLGGELAAAIGQDVGQGHIPEVDSPSIGASA